MSGQKRIKTEEQSIAITNVAGIYFSLENTTATYLDVRYTVASTTPITIGFSNKLTLSLLNDEVIELPLADVIRAETGAANNLTINPKYKITIEQIEKINSIGIKKIRLNTSQYYFDFDVKRKGWLKKFKEDSDCFIKEIK